jgi:hypothetical protein
VDLGSCLF